VNETGAQLFNLMFRPGETVCVSCNKYGYHSIPLENAINGPITLVPPTDNAEWMYPKPEELILTALNPIKGFRQDLNCTAFRNFLIEMDYGPLTEQAAYIKKLGMPYSAIVFSGNKSLHFLISLDTDLPSEKVYRVFSEWILNIVTLADQNTKNPSRSIRIPGAYREPGKLQTLVEFNGSVKVKDLADWLRRHPGEKPKEKQQHIVSKTPDFNGIKPWVCKVLIDGIRPPNRNKQWFSVAVAFALSGYSDDDTVDLLRAYFSPDRDFKEKEWEITVRSAFKWTYKRKSNAKESK
jgi:hypothetical protein